MSEKVIEQKRYDLRFRYTDNGQVYEENLLLSESEVEELTRALTSLIDSGDIESACRTDYDEPAYMLIPYSDPTFIPLEEMKEWWSEGILGALLDKNDFKWKENDDHTQSTDQ